MTTTTPNDQGLLLELILQGTTDAGGRAQARQSTPELCQLGLDILSWQKLKARLPSQLPLGTKVAHKTGTGSRGLHGRRHHLQGRSPALRPDRRTPSTCRTRCPTARRASPPPTSSSAAWRGSATTESADRDGTRLTIDRTAIDKTAAVIRPHVRVTPLLAVSGADFGLAAFPLSLKLELFQHAGSFKTRGAFANLLAARRCPPAGVVAASGGNHGAAVAYAAMRLGCRRQIFVPTVSSPAKIAAHPRATAPTWWSAGERYADALAASDGGWRASGALPVHAFDQHETLLGQGTLGGSSRRRRPTSTRCWWRSAAAA